MNRRRMSGRRAGGTLSNEVQRLALGTLLAPLTPDEGDFALTYDGQTAAGIAFNAGAAGIQAALEALSNLAPGDVSVTGSNPYTFTFGGTLAGTNVPQMTAGSVTLKQAAATINVTTTQAGISDTFAAPTLGGSFTPGIDGVSPVNEVQNLNLNSATSGTFDLAYNGGSAQTYEIGVTSLASLLDTILGNGNYSLQQNAGNWDITFAGSLAATNVPELAITNNSTDGSPSMSTTTQGVTGVTATAAVQTVTITPAAESGDWTVGGSFTAWSATPVIGSYNVTGSASAGLVTLTAQATGSMTSELTKDVGTLQYRSVTGRPTIAVMTLADAPTEGSFNLVEAGSVVGTPLDFDSGGANLQNSISTFGGGYDVTGSAGGPWTLTSSVHVSHTWTGSSISLKRAIGVQIETVTGGGT